jgi:hypothetical protein
MAEFASKPPMPVIDRIVLVACFVALGILTVIMFL